ncbi:MAG: pyruvate kinase [Candidatus Hydrogenedentota bacterium]
MRRTKIVCTLGPSSSTRETIESLVRAGMNVARFNFSHGTHADHRERYRLVRSIADELGQNVAILQDLQGPKMRTGKLEGGRPVRLAEGAPFCITTRPTAGNQHKVSTSYAQLDQDVQPGDRILLADGTMELRVEGVEPPDVHCVVVRGGLLGEQKGINLPGVAVSAASLTEKDVDDLNFGLELGVDFVALSFVRTPDDIRRLKDRIGAAGKSTPVVAKIERPEALARFDEIVSEADAIMVARGDLGVEVDLHRVPQIQKSLIRVCNERGVPVITATQMLESMMNNTRPTRAEAADVANAIYDGTDAVMLSGETASGNYPVEAVSVMAKIVESADEAIATGPFREVRMRLSDSGDGEAGFKEAIGQAVVRMTQVVDLKRIVVFTQSGYSAEAIARHRPRTPITAITLNEEARRRCALVWGVDATASVEVKSVAEMTQVVDRMVLDHSLALKGDSVVIVAGLPLGAGGRTNLLHLHRVGDPHGA